MYLGTLLWYNEYIMIKNRDKDTEKILKENYLALLEGSNVSSQTPAVKNIVNLFLDSKLSTRKREVFVDYAQDMIINRFNKKSKYSSSMYELYSDLGVLKDEIIGR